MDPRRNRSLLWLAAGTVLAAAAGLLAAYAVEEAAETERVLVAARDIEPFTAISPQWLRVEERPRAGLPDDVLREPAAAAGRFSRALLLEGTPVRRRHLVENGDRSALAARLTALNRPDLRQMAIPYTADTGVGGRIERNDRVDIQVTLKRIEHGGQVFGGPLTFVVARNVPVMDVVRGAQGGDGRGNAIVALEPEVAALVSQGLEGGTVRLLLNGYRTDESAADIAPVTPLTLMKRFNLQAVEPGRSPAPEAGTAGRAAGDGGGRR